jgi:pilus assembly protein CpaF
VPRQQYVELKAIVHRKLLNRLNLEALAQADRSRAESEIRTLVAELLAEEGMPLSLSERDVLFGELVDEVFGLGPLEPLLRDPGISDILVNTYKNVFVERGGLLERVNAQFQDDRHLLRVIDRIVSGVGRRIDDSSPMVDARLLDGSRVNAIIPPLAVDGPLHPPFSGGTAQGRGSRDAAGADAADARFSVPLRARPAERAHQRRHRLR